MSDEPSYSNVSIQAVENGKDLINVTTGQAFVIGIYDDDNHEFVGRMDSAQAGISFIRGTICCFIETLIINNVPVEDLRTVLLDLVTETLDSYTSDETKSVMN